MSVYSFNSTSTIINTLNDLFYMFVKISSCLIFTETDRQTDRQREREKCVKERDLPFGYSFSRACSAMFGTNV